MRKLLAILGMITCMAGLCACGQEESPNLPVSEEDLIASAEQMTTAMSQIIAQGPDVIEQYAADPVIYAGLTGLQSAMEDIGAINGTDGGGVSVKDDEIVVEINVLGTEHDAVVEIIFDDSFTNLISIATNVKYSLGENMTKAVMNTVVGMGTVFVVLIFISLIISCFGIFNKLGGSKKEAAAQSAAAESPVVEQIAQKEELAGDTELVAVIAAAVAAYEGAASTDGFVVRSIRKSNKSKWQNA